MMYIIEFMGKLYKLSKQFNVKPHDPWSNILGSTFDNYNDDVEVDIDEDIVSNSDYENMSNIASDGTDSIKTDNTNAMSMGEISIITANTNESLGSFKTYDSIPTNIMMNYKLNKNIKPIIDDNQPIELFESTDSENNNLILLINSMIVLIIIGIILVGIIIVNKDYSTVQMHG